MKTLAAATAYKSPGNYNKYTNIFSDIGRGKNCFFATETNFEINFQLGLHIFKVALP